MGPGFSTWTLAATPPPIRKRPVPGVILSEGPAMPGRSEGPRMRPRCSGTGVFSLRKTDPLAGAEVEHLDPSGTSDTDQALEPRS